MRRGLSRCAAGSSANGRDGAAPRTLYKGRRILLKTASLRTDRQKARADDLLADPANKPLALAHGVYQKIIACYAEPDRRKARSMIHEPVRRHQRQTRQRARRAEDTGAYPQTVFSQVGVSVSGW